VILRDGVGATKQTNHLKGGIVRPEGLGDIVCVVVDALLERGEDAQFVCRDALSIDIQLVVPGGARSGRYEAVQHPTRGR
jgi:hypothetical protein